MLFNYFVLALRNLRKQRSYAIINTLGLSVGLASAFFILLYVRHELTFDSYHPDSEQIYRLGYRIDFPNGEKEAYPYAPAGWDNYIKETYSGISRISSFTSTGMPTSVEYEPTNTILLTEEIIWAEPNLLEILSIDIKQGPKENPLQEMNSIMLAESVSRSLFGNEDPLNKMVTVQHGFMTNGRKINMLVSAVYKDIPSNSHIRPKYILNIMSLKEVTPQIGTLLNTSMADSDSINLWTQSFIVCQDESKIPAITEDLQTRANQLLQRFNLDFKFKPLIQKITNVHFDQDINWSIEHKSVDKGYIYIFISIAVLILLVACINYINLSTAKSVTRAKEIGLRKTFGGIRLQLFAQFMTESFVMVLLATVVAIILVVLFIPRFNDLTGKTFSIESLFNLPMLMLVGIVIISVTLLAGSYPAIFVSGFQPASVLKGKFAFRKGSNLFRQVLTTVQFVVAVMLLFGTVIVVRQMDLMRNSKLNEAGNQIVSIRYGGFSAPATDQHYNTFKNLVLQDPEIESVTLANHLPRLDFFGPINMRMQFPDVSEEQHEWFQLNGDYDFTKTFRLNLIAGRDFDPANTRDSTSVLLNESAVKALKLTPEEAIGKTIIRPSFVMNYAPPDSTAPPITGHIIGVVEDFPYRSMHMKIEPLAISPKPHSHDRIIHVRLPANKVGEKIASLEKNWKEVFRDFGFDYWFIDEEFAKMYENETQVAELVEKFSALAILITCFGLYGLASFLSEQRTKEIGIRKTLGASNAEILLLLLGVFAKLLLIACVIGLPVAYYFSNQWLESFVYKTSFSFLVFISAIGIIAVITMLTVGYESLKASMANPVNALKHES
jgi:putative ABC transport system permease protein